MTLRVRTSSPVDATTLTELIEKLSALKDLPPIDQARACPDLIELTKRVLALHRGWAIQQAQDAGMTQNAIAAELGIARSNVTDALTGFRREPVRYTP